jgi:pectate lyase
MTVLNQYMFSICVFLALACSDKLLTPVTVEPRPVSTDPDTASFPPDTGVLPGSDADTFEYAEEAVTGHVGFAAYTDGGAFALTGGDGGDVIEVATVAELQAAIDGKDDDTPRKIFVSGALRADEDEAVVEIIEVDGKRDLHIVGKDQNASLQGAGIRIKNESANIIIQNLTIHHVPGDSNDCIAVDNSHNIWIDHCSLFNNIDLPDDYDSLLDITHGSDYVTVSWNDFHDCGKGLIVGHSDDNAEEDADAFHVSYHHNKFSNIGPGQLSIRFGTAHVFNNQFTHPDGNDITALSSRMNACVRVEFNRFDLGPNNTPINTRESGTDENEIGFIEDIRNEFNTPTVPVIITDICELKVPDELPYAYLHTINRTSQLGDILREIGPKTSLVQP